MAQLECEYTEMWATKMRKVFNSLDRQNKGYITETMLMDLSEQCFKDHPKVERENVVKFQHRVWKDLYNCGKEVPKDHQMTEEMFIKNMWVSVNQPTFKELVKEISRLAFDQMDFDKSGFVSKDEYMKLNSWKAGEEQALAAFKLMDSDNDGKATFDELMDAKAFYYTDIHDPSHPYNLTNGPLDSPHLPVYSK